MFSLILRALVFLVIVGISAFLIQRKKGIVTDKREAKVETVLSKLVENGTPVDTQVVSRREFSKAKAFTLVPCSGNYCVYLSAEDVNNVKTGRTVYSPETNEKIGKVVSISSRPNMSDGLYRGYITLTTKPLATQAPHVVLVETTKMTSVLVIPADAITFLSGRTFVHKVTGEHSTERQEITVQDNNGLEYVVKSGLSEGDSIVVNGKSMIERFGKINIVHSEK